MMITVTDQTKGVLASNYTFRIRVQVWLDDALLVEDLPVVDISEDLDNSLNVPERITINMPRYANGIDYSTVVAANGHTIRYQLEIVESGEIINRGIYRVEEVLRDDNTLSITCAGLLIYIAEARFVSPFQPSGTLKNTIRSLVEPALTVLFDAGFVDRVVPSGINYDEDRLEALKEILNAANAEASVTEDGYLLVEAAVDPSVSVVELSSNSGDTVLSVSSKSSTDDAFNCVVARGTATDLGQVQGVAYLTTGPRAFGGAYNPLPVPFYFASPLLTTVAQCTAAAKTVLRRKTKNSGASLEILIVPDPRLQLGDCINVDGVLYTLEGIQVIYSNVAGATSAMKIKVVKI